MSRRVPERLHPAVLGVSAGLLCLVSTALAAPLRLHHQYALNVHSNDVSVIDTRSLTPIATLPVGKASYGAALAHGGALQ